MSDLIFYKNQNNKDSMYRTINIRCLKDPSLSWKAKGLLCYLMTRPKKWTVWNNDIQKRSTNGEKSIRSGVSELRKHGYVYKGKIYLRGRIKQWIYIVFSEPSSVIPPKTKREIEKLYAEKLQVRFVHVAFVHVENAGHSNNTISYKKVVLSKDNTCVSTKRKQYTPPSGGVCASQEALNSKKSFAQSTYVNINNKKKTAVALSGDNATYAFGKASDVSGETSSPFCQKTYTPASGEAGANSDIANSNANSVHNTSCININPFAKKIINFWNLIPNVTKHNKPTKVWLSAARMIRALRSGKLYKKRFDDDFLKRNNIPKELLKHKFSKEEIVETLKKIGMFCQEGYFLKNKGFSKSLPNVIYNPYSKIQSLFLIACCNNPKQTMAKVEIKYPEIAEYFCERTSVKLDEQKIRQLNINLKELEGFYNTKVEKNLPSYSCDQKFGSFYSLCKTLIDFLFLQENAWMNAEIKQSVSIFSPESKIFRKMIDFYEKYYGKLTF